MMLKKHGSEYSKAKEDAENDFLEAANLSLIMLEEFRARELNTGAAIGGALTQILTHLIDVSPDASAAMGLLSASLTNAAFQAEITEQAMRSESTTQH
tara:strand:- start:854 stop:1147 length:294 start_codon:yes stop_codon:yes gene_type:complete